MPKEAWWRRDARRLRELAGIVEAEPPSPRKITPEELRRDLNAAAIAISVGLSMLADVSRRYGCEDPDLERVSAPVRPMTDGERRGRERDYGEPADDED